MTVARRGDRYHNANWVRSLIKRGLSPDVVVLETCQGALVNDAEIFWLAYFRYIGCDLTNITAGGRGRAGFKLSDETKKAIGLSNRGKIRSLDVVQQMRVRATGRKPTVESIEKQASKVRGRKHSEEAKILMSEARGGTAIVDQYGTIYPSRASAAKVLGVNRGEITKVIQGKKKTVHGLVFSEVPQMSFRP